MNNIKKTYTDKEIEYATTARCQCGAGMAYPLDASEAMELAAWHCSAQLKGEVAGGVHDRLPFAYYKVREETSINNREGLTTRGPNTRALKQGVATCPECSTRWHSEPYCAHELRHHWLSGPCPTCGYDVGGGGAYTSSDGKRIVCLYKTVVVEVDGAA